MRGDRIHHRRRGDSREPFRRDVSRAADRAGLERRGGGRLGAQPGVIVRRLRKAVVMVGPGDGEERREEESRGSVESPHGYSGSTCNPKPLDCQAGSCSIGGRHTQAVKVSEGRRRIEGWARFHELDAEASPAA